MFLNKPNIYEIYKNDLVIFNDTLKINEEANDFKTDFGEYIFYLEENELKVIQDLHQVELFVILKEDELFDTHLKQLLNSIIKAIHIDLKLIGIGSDSQLKLNLHELLLIKNKKFITFGTKQDFFNLNITLQAYIEFQDKNRNIYLLSESLTELQNDPSKKKKLWQTLKKIFNI